jgi:hypothetical protein
VAVVGLSGRGNGLSALKSNSGWMAGNDVFNDVTVSIPLPSSYVGLLPRAAIEDCWRFGGFELGCSLWRRAEGVQVQTAFTFVQRMQAPPVPDLEQRSFWPWHLSHADRWTGLGIATPAKKARHTVNATCK